MFQWLIRLDQKVRRYMILAAPVSLLAGVIFPQVFSRLLPAVPWAFAAMTFCGSLGSSFRQLGEEFRRPRPLLVVLLILHVVLPLAAWGAGNLFFSHNPYLSLLHISGSRNRRDGHENRVYGNPGFRGALPAAGAGRRL